MKHRALVTLLVLVPLLLAPAALQAGEGDKPDAPACGCATGADGKVCGVDKDCCCTGEKAKPKDDGKKAS